MCTDKSYATRHIGPQCATKLSNRIADLLSAEVITNVIAGRGHALEGDRKGHYAFVLSGGVRLCVVPQEPAPLHDDLSIAWEEVSAVKVVEIGDYHD